MSAFLQSVGLRAQTLSGGIGTAAKLKMLRSVWSKGMEAAIIEALAAAHRARLAEEAWRMLNEFSRGDVRASIWQWITTHPAACARRADEMAHVIETVEETGVVLCANQMLRASVRAQVELLAEVKRARGIHTIGRRLAPIGDIFALQGNRNDGLGGRAEGDNL